MAYKPLEPMALRYKKLAELTEKWRVEFAKLIPIIERVTEQMEKGIEEERLAIAEWENEGGASR